MRALAFLAAVALAAAGLAGCGGAGGAGADGTRGTTPLRAGVPPVPKGFVGISASEVLPQKPRAQQASLDAQAAAGVEVFRQTFRWDYIEPRKGDFAFGMYDGLVASAARAGITILPIVFAVRPGEEAPRKRNVRITGTTTMPPRDPATFAAFATVLVKRYGRGGSFWKEHADLPAHPMTAWQVWNEPNLPAYWGGRANDKEYTRLLQATAAAIRGVDPKAEIVTGGLPQSRLGIPMVDYIGLLVKDGAKGSFDTLAIHPYAKDADGVLVGAQDAREALDAAGLENVNLWITEVGWATGGPRSDVFTVSRRQQGERLTELFSRARALTPDLRLRGIIYYGWRDVLPGPGMKDFWGLHTGLLTDSGKDKPALAVFSRLTREIREPQR